MLLVFADSLKRKLCPAMRVLYLGVRKRLHVDVLLLLFYPGITAYVKHHISRMPALALQALHPVTLSV